MRSRDLEHVKFLTIAIITSVKEGTKVKYVEGSFVHLTGHIKKVKGRKWIIVEWSDGIRLTEHVGDLYLYN